MNIIVLGASDSVPWYNHTGKEYHVQRTQPRIGGSMCNVTHRNINSARLDRNAPPLQPNVQGNIILYLNTHKVKLFYAFQVAFIGV